MLLDIQVDQNEILPKIMASKDSFYKDQFFSDIQLEHGFETSTSSFNNTRNEESISTNDENKQEITNDSTDKTTTKNEKDIHLQIGGRKSKLAVVQSEIVKREIEKRFPNISCSILALSTLGDQVQNKPLYSFGGKALWTRELEILLLESVDSLPQIDLIVHSLKDMPTNLPEEFELGCILEREDPRDALVMKHGSKYNSLDDLPDGSIVGTSSVRRSAQLSKNYPQLRFESVRGNVQTRLRKLDDPESSFECLLLAAAGLLRLGLGDRITSCLDAPEMYYAVGQGALGVEIRKNDGEILEILKKIEHLPTAYSCIAERSLMRTLEGGCSVPIGVHSDFDSSTEKLTLKGIVVSANGEESIEDEVTLSIKSKDDAAKAGIELAHKLVEKGAKKILEEINFEKINQPPTPNSTPITSAPPSTAASINENSAISNVPQISNGESKPNRETEGYIAPPSV